jgi:hypothetical protein
LVVVVELDEGVVLPVGFDRPSEDLVDVDVVVEALLLLLLGSRTTTAMAISTASTNTARRAVRLRLRR